MSTTDSARPPCPECGSEYTYALVPLLVCPECAHERTAAEEADGPVSDSGRVIRHAVGNVLADGDTVSVVKDLKVMGAGGGVVKVGTRVKNAHREDQGNSSQSGVAGPDALELGSSPSQSDVTTS